MTKPDAQQADTPSTAPGFDRSQIEQYLAFGFVPNLDVEDPLSLLSRWSRLRVKDEQAVSEAGLLREGVVALRQAMEECASIGGAGDQVVFLSGGVDSRTILGGLLWLFDRSQVVAATFGLPGEKDFDFATKVATRAGVRHETLESFSVDWTTERLVDSVLARQVPLPSVFGQRYLSYRLHQRIGPDNVFWDGLCGDVVGGKCVPKPLGDTWESAVEAILAAQLQPGWPILTRPGFDPRRLMPTSPFCPADRMAYPVQLVFALRQRCRTGLRLLNEFPTRTPFLTRPWLDFMLSVPPRFRRNQYLYREIQREAFPALAALPSTAPRASASPEPAITRTVRDLRARGRRTATSLGLLREGPRANRANLGVRSRYRRDGQLRELVRENIADLARRGVIDWVDVTGFAPGSDIGADPSESAALRLLDVELNLKAADRLAA